MQSGVPSLHLRFLRTALIAAGLIGMATCGFALATYKASYAQPAGAIPNREAVRDSAAQASDHNSAMPVHGGSDDGSAANQPANPAEAAQAVKCNCPGSLARFKDQIARTAQRINRGDPVTVVAVGSSSTAGAGASSPAHSYPSRLVEELRQRFPQTPVRMINRGQNGDTIPGMLKRLDENVLAEKPDLVIWQLGTNSVLRDESLLPMQAMVHEGLRRIRAAGADVILIDPQFAPRVTEKPEAVKMVNLIGTIAEQEHVPLFRRFAIMRAWHDQGMPFNVFLDRDQLHLNDWSYGCVARLLGEMIADKVAAHQPVRLKQAVHTPADALE